VSVQPTDAIMAPAASVRPRAEAVSLAAGESLTHMLARQRTNEGNPGAVGVEDGHGRWNGYAVHPRR
jgi:hypothetical protein